MFTEGAAACEKVQALINHSRAHVLDQRQLPCPLLSFFESILDQDSRSRLFVKANSSQAKITSKTREWHSSEENCSTWLHAMNQQYISFLDLTHIHQEVWHVLICRQISWASEQLKLKVESSIRKEKIGNEYYTYFTSDCVTPKGSSLL